MKLPARISPTARAAVKSAKEAQAAAKAARASVDEIEACLAAARQAAADAQHQADLAAAEANRLSPGTTIMRTPAPDNSEIELISAADPSHLADLSLKELFATVEFPSFDLPSRNTTAKQPCGRGELEVSGSGFLYTEWDNTLMRFKLYMSVHLYSASHNSIYIDEGSHSESYTVDQIVGTKWEPVIRALLIEAWTRRHGPIARELANLEYQAQIDRHELVHSIINK